MSKLKKYFLPLHEPNISKDDKQEVMKGIESGFVSTAGKDVKRFENVRCQFKI